MADNAENSVAITSFYLKLNNTHKNNTAIFLKTRNVPVYLMNNRTRRANKGQGVIKFFYKFFISAMAYTKPDLEYVNPYYESSSLNQQKGYTSIYILIVDTSHTTSTNDHAE